MEINPDATPGEIQSALASRQLRWLKVAQVSRRLEADIQALEIAWCQKTGGHELRPDGATHPHSGQERMSCRKCGAVEYR